MSGYSALKCGRLRVEHVGKEVDLYGWVAARRDHGRVIFNDLRDRRGAVQDVFNPTDHPSAAALAADLGWPATPAVGFACGLDRTVAMLAEEGIVVPVPPAAEVLVLGDGVAPEPLAEVGVIARRKRRTAVDYTVRSLAAKMRSANKVGVRWVALMNAEEAGRRVLQLKEMTSGAQREVHWADLPEALA